VRGRRIYVAPNRPDHRRPGAVVMGTVADDVGLLADITGLLTLPNLAGVGDSVSIVLPPGNFEQD
jgi:hypothetical protein